MIVEQDHAAKTRERREGMNGLLISITVRRDPGDLDLSSTWCFLASLEKETRLSAGHAGESFGAVIP
jgi:hypothetical protein